jgi:superfamily II DNA or RNA helicase
MASFDKFLSSFESSNLKGKQFEKFCKWFLENDTYWKSKFTKVYLWDDYPKRWGADLGIDLIAEDSDGDLCAVQAKCYNSEYSVSKKDMDSFLSESNRKEISSRLLLATTDSIGSNAKKVCKNQEKPVTFFLLSDFQRCNLSYPDNISLLSKPKKTKKPEPKPHQKIAIQDVVNGFKTNDKGQMIMACGTGKTFITLWIKEKLEAESTLILLPSLNLLSQTLKEWYFAANKLFKSLAVCSDETVIKQASDDEIKESTQDLSFPVTTNVTKIKKFLIQDGPKVIFSTYQSSPMIYEAMKDSNVPDFNLVICDEAHRCAGDAGKIFSTVLDDKKIRTKRKLFATATPRIYSESQQTKARNREIKIIGMDDENIFGPEFHKLSFGQAIANEPPLLTDYQVVIIGVDSPMIEKYIQERELIKINSEDSIDSESLAAYIAVLKSLKIYKIKRLISFHGRVKRARNFSHDILDISKIIQNEFKPNGQIRSDYVSGEMPTSKRTYLLKELKELNNCDQFILSNARCLSEGVDIPSIDGIAIIDPRKSKTDIIQMIGRAIRLSDNKEKGTIILPIFINPEDSAEENLKKSNFKTVYEVINALKSHDENLAIELEELKTSLGRRPGLIEKRKLPKITIDLPLNYSHEFELKVHSILIDNLSSDWFFWYGLLLSYIDSKLQLKKLTPKIIFNNQNLGRWVEYQKELYKNNKLDSKKIIKLESIDGWTWTSVREQYWEDAYDATEEFIKKFDRLPKINERFNDINIGKWIAAQRQLKRDGELSQIKIELLQKLPNLNWDSYYDIKWKESYNLYVKYVKEYNTFTISLDFYSEGIPIGRWLAIQKRSYKKNTLEDWKIKKLEAIEDWTWETHAVTIFYKNLDKLKRYLETHTFDDMPFNLNIDGTNIAAWIRTQKRLYASKELDKKKIKALEKVENWSWSTVTEKAWFDNHSLLKEFLTKFGIKKLTSTVFYNNFGLGSWATKQRKLYVESKLSKEQIKLLEDIEGWTWVSQYSISFTKPWNDRFELLLEYIEKYGVEKINTKIVYKDFLLGSWVKKQRYQFKNNKLSKEKIELLENIKGWLWKVN